jgi:protein disulfide-isomerase
MKKSILILFVTLSFAGLSRARDDAPPTTAPAGATIDWRTDYAASLANAKQEHRLALLDFTGSDWCVWCHRLTDEVFSQKPFVDYARDHLMLVELDFPRGKTLSPELKRQNATLAEKFGVEGYPTVIVVDGDGRELARLGYMEGGAKTFVRELKRIAAKAAADHS